MLIANVKSAVWKRLLSSVALSCLILLTCSNVWSGIEVSQASLESSEEGYVINAQFDIQLTSKIEEALSSGVALYFVIEFELVRRRWYWFDERSIATRQQYRLSYHALSRQYRLWSGNLHQPFGSLAEALRVLGRVRSWSVLEKDQVQNGQTYQAAVRMQLDTAQLPRLFQIPTLTGREWDLQSDWKRFTFTPLAPVVNRRGEEVPSK